MQQGTGSITGTAKGANGESLSNYTVRARNPATGQIAAQTTSNSAGTFSFTGLAPGNYVVEVVNTAGQVVGLSSALAVTAGGTAAVTVTATAAGAAAAAAGGGFSLFGLGTAASIAVIGGAAAAGIVAIVAANNNASPSK
jgi:hypothetical protein